MGLEGYNLHTLWQVMPTECQHLCQENLEQQLLQVLAWHSEMEVVLLIAGEVNWRVAVAAYMEGRQRGSHNLEGQCVVGTDMNLEPWVTGMLVMGLFSTEVAGGPVRGTFTSLAPGFPQCQVPTFSWTLGALRF